MTSDIPTVEPEHEPEYVGAFGDAVDETCQNYVGECADDISKCESDATHTVVMRRPQGGLVKIAMCDECGEPDDVGPVPGYV